MTVWEALTDLEGRVRWSDRLLEMSVINGDDLAIDSQMRIRVDRSKFKVNVTQFDPPAIMVIGATNPVMTFSHAYRINAVSAGFTVLSLTGSLGGILGVVMGALTK